MRQKLIDQVTVRLTAKRAERAAGASGAAKAAAVRDRAALITARELVPLPPSPLPDKLYAATDGTGVPVTAKETAGRDGKGEDGRARTREVKLAVFFTQDKDDDGYPVRDRDSSSYIATFEPASTFAGLVEAEGIRRGAGHVRQLTIPGDGAAWIWNIATAKFPEATQIVDLFHAREHLHDLARSLEFMLGDQKRDWPAARLEDLDYGDIDGICNAARVYPLAGVKKDELDTALGYFENNAPRMRYHWFRSRGLFIGSGAVESGCKAASASSSPACTGPSTEQTPSPPCASQLASAEFRRTAASSSAVGRTTQARHILRSWTVGSSWAAPSASNAATQLSVLWPSSPSSAPRAWRLSSAVGSSGPSAPGSAPAVISCTRAGESPAAAASVPHRSHPGHPAGARPAWPAVAAPGRGLRRPRYDHDKYRRQVRKAGITPVIVGAAKNMALASACVHRWVVEQNFALLHWFRRLRVRWEIRDDIHEAFLSLACGIICWRRLASIPLC